MRIPHSFRAGIPRMLKRRIPSILRKEPILWPLLLLLFAVYIIPHTPLPGRFKMEVSRKYNSLPDFKVDMHPSRTFRNRFSTNKTVLYIETRPQVMHITPLLLHMTQVVPPEWRFVFLGTEELVERVNASSPVRRMAATGKLRLGSIERWTKNYKGNQNIHEINSRLLTNTTFYDQELPGVEYLLVFRSNSIICANANRTVNDYLQYDWVGAPWNTRDKFGGNGGLSLRRVSRIREVLAFQQRLDNTASEDQWLSGRIGLLPGANPANATVEQRFAVEDVWYDKPLGYHINPVIGPGKSEQVWGDQIRRKQIFQYCPEVKIIMNMRLERERCPPEPAAAEGTKVGKRDIGIEGSRSEAEIVDVKAAGAQDSPDEIKQQALGGN